MRFKFEVTVVDEGGNDCDLVAVSDARDIRKWESAHGSFFEADTTFTVLTQLAYYALLRSKQYSGTEEQFMDSCVSLSEVSDMDPTEPPAKATRKAPTGKRSSR